MGEMVEGTVQPEERPWTAGAGHCVRAPRNRTHGKHIDYKELAHVVTEADKSQALQGEWASWRQKSRWGGPSPRA